jgi:vacuolar-type H+-ATPase subunit H
VSDAAVPPGETNNASIEALKRLKAAETDAEAKLRQAVDGGSERLKQLALASEESVRAATAASEKDADAAIERARTSLAGDVAAVVQVGQADAAKVGSRSKSALANLEPKLLDAVLGEFRSD